MLGLAAVERRGVRETSLRSLTATESSPFGFFAGDGDIHRGKKNQSEHKSAECVQERVNALGSDETACFPCHRQNSEQGNIQHNIRQQESSRIFPGEPMNIRGNQEREY